MKIQKIPHDTLFLHEQLATTEVDGKKVEFWLTIPGGSIVLYLKDEMYIVHFKDIADEMLAYREEHKNDLPIEIHPRKKVNTK